MSTERLYYGDAYTLTFDANVIEHLTYHEHPAVVLDRSYFYPEGGGQLPDTGTLNDVRVIDVQTRDSDRAVIHVLAAALHAEQVHGVIDGSRRRDLMRHHSGQHVLSQALLQAAQAQTVSVHMSLDSMTIDVNRPLLTPAEIRTVEALANRIVLEDRPVRAWFPDAAELPALGLRKLPDVSGALRVIDMGGFDVTACGGTHVARTAEIGLIKIIRQEKRGSGTRLEFKCAERALEDYAEKNDVINRLAADLTVAYTELPDSIARLRDENKALRAELKIFREQALDVEARDLVAAAPAQNGYHIVTSVFDRRDANDVKLLAQKIMALPNVVALLGTSGEKAQLIFGRSEDVSVDVVPLLKTALKSLGTDRGGGRPNFAQGGGIPADSAQLKAALDLAKVQHYHDSGAR